MRTGKVMDYYRTIKYRVITLHRAEPTLDTAAVAARVGTSCHTVREISRQCGLPIPRAKNGRKPGSTGSKWYARTREETKAQASAVRSRAYSHEQPPELLGGMRQV